MLKFAKIINESTKKCDIGLSDNADFYKSIGFEEMEVEKCWDGSWYLTGHCPPKPEPGVEESILSLEKSTGLTRAMRELVLAENSGASNYIKQKAQEIENKAQVLRVSDDMNEIQEAINAETLLKLSEK